MRFDPAGASDLLRSELIFLPDDGRVVRFDGGLAILTPSNPDYWWGNTLHLDRPPHDGDFDRWMAAFASHVQAVQPASVHRTFGWDGPERGAIEPFVDAGFRDFETVALAVDRDRCVVAPKPDAAFEIVRIAGDDWNALRRLQVETRDPWHDANAYDGFMSRRIAGWRTLEERGAGAWFAARRDGRLVSALGVYGERERGADGRRIGRFQFVVTDPAWRRRGLAGMLVEEATRFAFERLDVDVLYLLADANDAARRVYEGCGYRARSMHRGLERAH